MKSPACTQCRWGTGTTTDRIPDTDASKEIKARLAAVMAERNKQDCMWTTTAEPVKKEITSVTSRLYLNESTTSLK
jgi:hypothetical protein